MRKMLFLTFVLLLIISAAVSAREVVGHLSTDDPYLRKITPTVSYTLPQNYNNAVVISSPQQVINFFKEKGINMNALEMETLPLALKDELCSICMECCDEFQNVLLDVVVQYVDTRFEAYIVKVGDFYWSFYA
jgi:hypothetical protein